MRKPETDQLRRRKYLLEDSRHHLYAVTGEDSLMMALQSIWEDVVQRKLFITGACGALPADIDLQPRPMEIAGAKINSLQGRADIRASEKWEAKLYRPLTTASSALDIKLVLLCLG